MSYAMMHNHFIDLMAKCDIHVDSSIVQLISNYYYYYFSHSDSMATSFLCKICTKRKWFPFFAECWFIRKSTKQYKLLLFQLASIRLVCWTVELLNCCYGNQMDWCQLFTFKFISLQFILVHLLLNAHNRSPIKITTLFTNSIWVRLL